MTLQFHTGPSIVGTLLTQAGAPVASAKVTARRANFIMNYESSFTPTAMTDADGKFIMNHLAEGDHVLTAEIPSSYGPISPIPRQLHVDGKKPVETVALRAAPGITIRGKVLPTKNVDITRIQLDVLLRLPNASTWSVRPAADGAFEITGLPQNASCTIATVEFSGFSTHFAWNKPPAGVTLEHAGLQIRRVEPGLYDGLEIEILPLASVTGTLRDETGAPVYDVWVENVATHLLAKTHADGTFEHKVPARERSHLEVHGEGQVDTAISEDFTLEPGDHIERNLTARRIATPDSTQLLRGKVVDAQGTPVKGAAVILGNSRMLPNNITNTIRPVAKPTWTSGIFDPATTRSGDDGAFTFDYLLAGTTDLWAFDPKSGLAWARNVETTRDGLVLTLKQQPATMHFAGQVLDPAGKPVADAHILLFNGDHLSKLIAESHTAADGRYILEANRLRPEITAFNYLACSASPPTTKELSTGTPSRRFLPMISPSPSHPRSRCAAASSIPTATASPTHSHNSTSAAPGPMAT